MKLNYILGGIAAFSIFFTANAQDEAAASARATNDAPVQTETTAGETTTIFSEGPSSTYGGCSLIQIKERDRKVTTTKKGYKLVTAGEDEVLEIKRKNNGDRKIDYYNDYETLDYHIDENGKYHYNYSYINGCKKVKVRRNKKGITSVTNKSGMEITEVRNNVNNAVKTGLRSCFNPR